MEESSLVKISGYGMLKFHKLGNLRRLVNFQEKKLEIFSQFLSTDANGRLEPLNLGLDREVFLLGKVQYR